MAFPLPADTPSGAADPAASMTTPWPTAPVPTGGDAAMDVVPAVNTAPPAMSPVGTAPARALVPNCNP